MREHDYAEPCVDMPGRLMTPFRRLEAAARTAMGPSGRIIPPEVRFAGSAPSHE